MVNGGFRCIGSTQRLKSKYGEGFTVLLKLKADLDTARRAEESAKVCEAMDELFPNENQLISSHQVSMISELITSKPYLDFERDAHRPELSASTFA